MGEGYAIHTVRQGDTIFLSGESLMTFLLKMQVYALQEGNARAAEVLGALNATIEDVVTQARNR